jgi:hypothetical protein
MEVLAIDYSDNQRPAFGQAARDPYQSGVSVVIGSGYRDRARLNKTRLNFAGAFSRRQARDCRSVNRSG